MRATAERAVTDDLGEGMDLYFFSNAPNVHHEEAGASGADHAYFCYRVHHIEGTGEPSALGTVGRGAVVGCSAVRWSGNYSGIGIDWDVVLTPPNLFHSSAVSHLTPLLLAGDNLLDYAWLTKSELKKSIDRPFFNAVKHALDE